MYQSNPFDSRLPAIGVGPLMAVPSPTGTQTNVPLTNLPQQTQGVRFYLPAGASVTYAIDRAFAQGQLTVTLFNTGQTQIFDENVGGGMIIFVTAASGGALYRAI